MMNLFVPVSVRCMLMGKPAAGSLFSFPSNDYKTLSVFPSGRFVPTDLLATQSGADMGKGAYLHWSMPACLKNGVQKGEEITYPALPDRWQVTRIWYEKEQGLLSRSWQLESNAMERTATTYNHGSVTWPMPYDPVQKWRYLGRAYPLEQAQSVTAPSEWLEQLTAVAPGNMMFAAYAPDCYNVFAFYDDLSDLCSDGTVTYPITYSVQGFYVNQKQDPLQAVSSAEDCLEQLGWHAPEHAQFPAKTICHGMVGGIQWQGVHIDYAQALQQLPAPDLAVGNTSAEAWAALTAARPDCAPHRERMLVHLMAGNASVIHRRAGLYEAEKRLHEKRFAPDVLTTKVVDKKEQKNDCRQPNTVDKINACYEQLAICQAALADLQEQVYDNWYRYLLTYEKNSQSRLLQKYEQLILDAKAPVLACKKDIEDLQDQITALTKDQDFTDQSGQRYWEPVNPVLLLSNISRAGMAEQADEQLLLARIAPLDRLSFEHAGCTISAKELLSKTGETEQPGLEGEAVLLSSSFTEQIAILVLKKIGKAVDPTSIGQMKETVRQLQQDLLTGKAGPLPMAVNEWQAPWLPLYLEWEATYIPDPETVQELPQLTNWRRRGDDYVYAGPELSWKNGHTIKGKQIITPHAAFQLADCANEIFGETCGAEQAQLLSQAMNGLHERLLMQELTILFPAEASLRIKASLRQMVDKLMMGFRAEHPVFDQLFAPLRAGFVKLVRLHIVDAFGQVMRVNEDRCAVSENLRQNNSPYQSHVMLPPRILQKARLYFQWQPEQPVCGWLVPNPFDHTLHVFDSAGLLRGSLVTICQDGDEVVFKAPPEQGEKTIPVPKDLNKDLYEFLNTLIECARRQKQDLLTELLQCMDNAMWRSNSGTAAQDASLGAYLGRPVALARAAVRLETYRQPCSYKYQDVMKADGVKSATGACVQLEAACFPVQVGQSENQEDGVIGFFVGQNYQAFYSPFLSTAASEREENTECPYFYQQNEIFLQPQWQAPAGQLTMMLDPFGAVHFDSGILPLKTVRLDQVYVGEMLKNLYHTIRCAPFLFPKQQSALDSEVLSFPYPDVEGKDWSVFAWDDQKQWLQYGTLQKTSQNAVFLPLWIRDGYLQLRKAKKTSVQNEEMA